MRILLRDLTPGTQYAIQLRSQDANGNTSAWSRIFYLTTTADTIAPNTPTGLAVVSNGSTFVATWNAVTQSSDGTPAHDLAGYLVQVDSPLGAGTRTYKTVDTRLEFPFESNVSVFGTPRATVRFSVAAIDSTGNTSAYSAQVQASNPAPAAPTGFVADPVVDGIALKWNAVADTDLTGYRIYHGTTAGTQSTLVWSGNATSKTVANFAYSADAYYRVVAVDVFNTESTTGPVVGPVRPKSSFAIDTTPPSVPTGLAATLTNATDGKTAKAVVTWTAVADPDNDLSEYIVGYKPSAETDWQYVKVDYTNTSTTITGLLPYTNYDFRVRASDWAANLSAWSSVVTKTATANAAPATVTGVAVTGGKDSLTIKWTPNTEPDVANGAGVYLVDVATNTGFTTGLLSYRTGEASLTVTGLAQGTTYYVRVKAVDSLGLASAAWSTTASAATGTLATQFTYTKSTTAPTSPNTGDIWFDQTSGFEKQWSGSAWVLTGNASIDYVAAKATDLIVNGTGSLGTNYNFSQFTVDKTDAPIGASLAFDTPLGAAGTYYVDEYIPVDPSKKLKFSFQAKQKGTATDARAYCFVTAFDAYKQQISPQHVMYQPNTLTTLAAPLNPGDTTITLTSSANWYGQAGKSAGTNTHYRSIIWWDYTDPGGKLWAPETYSRNWSGSDYWADGGITGNVITLKAPYSGPAKPAGTKLSNGSSGGTYMYGSLANQAPGSGGITTDWTTFTATIVGINTAGTSPAMSTGWPQGTGYARVGWLLNRDADPAGGYVDANSKHSIAAVSLSDASAAQADVAGAVKTYVNEYAVNSSETVAPSSGWSTSTPTRTPGTFVWFRTTVTRADGTTSTTSPALLTGNTGAQGSQGIPGTPGADGVSLYTWVKYADTPTTGMSDSPTGKTYMGIAYNKTSSTESSVYSDYEWSLIKGSDGIQGPPGADGTTTYTWVKYADTATGTGMSDDPTGKTYIGLAFNKTTATESTTATDYQWSLIQGPQGPQGVPGTPAAIINLTATSQVLSVPAAGGATTPATTTVTGTATNTTITAWTYSVDGAAFSATVPAGVSRTGNVVTITGSTMTAKTIAVRMADANGIADTLTVAKVSDGATGATGGTGSTGPAGADAYTVILTNEAQVFAGSTSAANAGSATTSVIAYKGATQIPATIGTITGQVTGLTTAITNNGTNNATVTVTVTTALTTQSGTLTIPVTVDGKSFTKTFAWSVSYTGATGAQGPQGIQGPTGPNGQTLYTWIKYADTPTTGMSDSPTGKTYMGIAYNKTSSTESSVYTDYEWSLIKGADGAQGIQGPPGADGQPTYTWIKYGTSAAGAGLSDDPTGKTYIGIAYNKTTPTESTVATDYEWSLIQGPQGPAGANAEVINLIASTQVLTSPSGGGATSPTTATVTGNAINTTIGYYEYSVDGGAFSTTVPTGASRTGNVVTITGGTMTAKTIAVRMSKSNGSPIADTITVAKVFDGATGAQGPTGPTGGTGAAGADAVTVLLTNEAATFAAGTTNALAGSATTQVNAWKGTTAQSVSVGTITGGATGITAAVTNNNTTSPTITFTVTTALTTANGTFTIPVTAGGITVNQIFTWSLAFTGAQGTQGNPGANAKSIDLTTTTQVLASPSGGGATTPATATVTGAATNTTISVWEYAVDGGAFSGTVPAGVSRTGNVVTITGSTMTARTITVRMADAGGVADTLTVAKTFDGATGATGGTGSTGPAGADAYTVILSNEAQVFPGSTTAALAGSATSSVIAYKGATQIAATIGTITGQVTGLTTAITNNGTTNATVTVTVTTALTTQSGVLTIPITADGKSFTKSFAWSVSYTGAQGATGNTGPTGVGITSVTPYFAQVTTGAAAPAKPTTATPSAPWTATEPDYVANTELYRTEKVLYTNATYSYTDVQKVSSYAAAATAIASATGKNKITHSTGTPGTTANTAGDTWVQYDGSNNIIAQFRGMGGTTWVQESIASAFIANLDAGKLTANSAFVTTLNIGSGGVIQSAGYTSGGSSGFQLSTSGLVIKGSGNTVDAGVLKGGIITGTTINVGAGGTLNVDSTGVIKSNNYSSGSTGYQLSNTGLEVNDGSIDAKALKTGSAVIGDLTIGRSADTAGSIKSFGYSAGVSGFRLDKTGLEINDGSISASALKLQNGHNMMPLAYADFEFGDAYYIHPFWNPRGQAKFTLVGGGLATNNLADANATPISGKYYFGMTTLGGTNSLEGWMGATTTDYNINVDPGQTYIISGYFKNWSPNPTTWNLVVKGNDGSTLSTTPMVFATGSQTAWTRVSAVITIPASGVTKVIVGVTNPDTTVAKDLHIDAMQFEPKLGALNTPSVWKPPAQTTIDASGITTGMLRSNNDIVVGGSTQPAWSLNKDGNMQVGDALVRGKLIIGTGNETLPNVAPAGGNFETTDITSYAAYSSGATGVAIARTTTVGEVITGAGSLKVAAAAGTKSALGVTVTNGKTYVAGTTVTVKGRFKTNAAGGTVNVTFWDSATTSNATQTVNVMSNPAANTVYYIEASYTIPPGIDNAFFSIYQAGTITTTSFIVDDISLQANDTLGESFIASGNFISGEGGTGWRIDGQGNAEINSGIFRGQLGARTVTADSIASVITMSSIFRTGISGKRIEFSSDGFAMYDSDETQIIYLPTDPLLPSSFAGDVLASSLTISDQLAIRGSVNELSKGATLTIASGTTAPSSPATVTVDWDNYDASIGGAYKGFEPYRYGFAYTNHFGGRFVTVQNVYGGTPYLDYFNTSGGRTAQSNEVDFTDASGGVTSIGSVVYVLGKVSNGDWYVKGYDTSGVEMSSWKYPHNATLHRKPAIGTDGTNIVVTFCGSIASGSGHVQWRVFNKTTGAQIGSTVGAGGLVLGADMSSVNIGTFDMGTTRVVVTAYAYNTAYVLDTAGNRVSTYDFPTASKPYGVCWANKGDGVSSFYSFDAPGNKFYRYSGATWTAAGDESWTVANTWYDSNATGGTHETNLGPQRTFTMKKRARVTITAPPLPIRPTPTTTDDAVAVGVYMARGAVSSGTVLAASRFERQGYLPDGVRSKTYHTEGGSLTTLPAAGANGTNQPPTVSNFASSAPGLLTSSNNVFQLYGDGSGQWGGLTVDPAGQAVLSGNVQAPAYINLGSTSETTSRQLRIFKKATAGTNYYESRQYLYDGGTTSGWANVIFENGAESARVQFNPVDGRMSLKNTSANVTRYVPIVDAGTASINAIAAGGAQTISVTFNTGRFTATPILTATSDSGRHNIACTARSTTGATFVVNNWSGANASAGTLQWIAVQE